MLGPKPSPGGVGAAAAMLHQITTGRASLPAADEAHSAAARPKSARAAKGTGGGGGGGGAGGWYPETIVEPGAGLRRYRDALFELGETVHILVLPTRRRSHSSRSMLTPSIVLDWIGQRLREFQWDNLRGASATGFSLQAQNSRTVHPRQSVQSRYLEADSPTCAGGFNNDRSGRKTPLESSRKAPRRARSSPTSPPTCAPEDGQPRLAAPVDAAKTSSGILVAPAAPLPVAQVLVTAPSCCGRRPSVYR